MFSSATLRRDGFAPLKAYAVLSDQRTAALVAADGAIDWLCLPRFDGEPVFGALLDPDRGGRFALRPAGEFEATRRYLTDTNVLETTWTTATGTVRVTDALCMGDHRQPWIEVVRSVEGLSGSVDLRWSVEPRAGWSREVPRIGLLGDVPAIFCGEATMVVRTWEAGEPELGSDAVCGEWTAEAGTSALLALEACQGMPLLLDGRERVEARLHETIAAWRRWIGYNAYDGPWAGAVRRSLLALGACIHQPSGAFVAAPTTSLPERAGGPRNYDYRYCWLRDTSFALDALLRSGLQPVVHASLSWLLGASRRTLPHVAVYYSIDGRPGVTQQSHDWPGWRHSTPVVTGNSAAGQLQLGGYGDVMETAWLWVRDGNALDPQSGRQLADIASQMCRIWRNPDAGIWELGSRPRDYTKSKADAWVTLDRALWLASHDQLPGEDRELWRRTRDEVRRWVLEHGWSAELGSFVRSGDGTEELDAALLMLSRMGIVPGDGHQMAGTIDAVRSRLGAGGPLLYRFTGADEFEGAFLACSFWLADALTRAGAYDEAAAQIEAMLGHANDVGLYSEEIDPSTGDFLGNLPQALSHLTLINAVMILHDRTAGEDGGRRASPMVA